MSMRRTELELVASQANDLRHARAQRNKYGYTGVPKMVKWYLTRKCAVSYLRISMMQFANASLCCSSAIAAERGLV